MEQVKDYEIEISPVENKKYRVYVNFKDGTSETIDFGDTRYEHYKTSNKIPSKLRIYEEHRNLDRRYNYLTRAKHIKNKYGEYTYNDPHYANYWSVHFLW